MSLTDDTMPDAAHPAEPSAAHGVGTHSAFRFMPAELTVKCRKLIESYHAMHGYGCLPDMLWHSDARALIDSDRDLARIFRSASKSRCAKRANESLVVIATIVISREALARDFAGWGKSFPAAKREAEAILGDNASKHRTWFMDMYLYPPLGAQRQLAGTLLPSASAGHVRH